MYNRQFFFHIVCVIGEGEDGLLVIIKDHGIIEVLSYQDLKTSLKIEITTLYIKEKNNSDIKTQCCGMGYRCV